VGLAVLVSGAGTNLQAILKAAEAETYPARVVAVASNHSGCRGLELALQAGVPVRSFPISGFNGDLELRDAAMAEWLGEQGASLVALAGYDRILTSPMLRAFPSRVLNLHNSLLPAFAGTMTAVRMALDEDRLDGGPIVLQAAVPVESDDTEETLLERIHEQEWRILPQAIALLARGSLRVEGRRVWLVEPTP
jgi:phosphoribosylglycinamide formyltransferase-1